MANKRNRRSKGFSGFGNLFFGILLGVVLTVVATFCVGLWAYNNITVTKLASWFNVEIKLENDPNNIKNMSIGEFLNFGQSYVDNYKDISLQDLENDFGIKIFNDGDYGINDWSKIKAMPLYNLSEDASVIADEITLDTLETLGHFSFPDMPVFNKYKQGGANEGAPIMTVVDDLMDAFDPSVMILNDLQTLFGFNLPDNAIINNLKTYLLTDLQNGIENTMDIITLNDLKTLGIDLTAEPMFENLGDTALKDLPAELKKITVGEALNIGENETGILNAIRNFTLGYSGEGADNSIAANIENITMEDIFDISDSDTGIMHAIKDYTIATLPENINSITMQNIFNISDTDTGLMAAIKNFTVGYSGTGEDLSLASNINSLTMKSILNIGDDAAGIMGAIKNYTITQMQDEQNLITAINGLKLNEILDAGQIAGSGLLSELPENTTILTLPQAIATLLDPDTLTVGKMCDITGAARPGRGWDEKTITEVLQYLSTIDAPA